VITFKVEATIDVDEKRRIWITGSAEATPEALAEHGIGNIVEALSDSVVQKAMGAYAAAVVPRFKSGGKTEKEVVDEISRLRGETPEVDPMATFGDD
jgi:hypothetical protein